MTHQNDALTTAQRPISKRVNYRSSEYVRSLQSSMRSHQARNATGQWPTPCGDMEIPERWFSRGYVGSSCCEGLKFRFKVQERYHRSRKLHPTGAPFQGSMTISTNFTSNECLISGNTPPTRATRSHPPTIRRPEGPGNGAECAGGLD